MVVADMNEALPRWQALTGGTVTVRASVEHQRVEIAMLEAECGRLELIRPTSDDSGVARFLAKRGESLHHVALEVDDIRRAMSEMRARGQEFIDAEPREAPDGLIAFLHPRSTGGVLVELVQAEGNEPGGAEGPR